MATSHYRARVRDTFLLELPKEAQVLDLQPGENVTVSVDRTGIDAPATHSPNEKGLAAMREIAERQKSAHQTDDTDSLKLLHEARAGAMYGHEPIK